MQIQITRTPIRVTNDARYYLCTSDCKLKRQGLSIWPFQRQRGERRKRHCHPPLGKTPLRYQFLQNQSQLFIEPNLLLQMRI